MTDRERSMTGNASPPLVRSRGERRAQGEPHEPASPLHDQGGRIAFSNSGSEAKKGESPVAIDWLAALVKARSRVQAEGQDVTFKVAVKDGKVAADRDAG